MPCAVDMSPYKVISNNNINNLESLWRVMCRKQATTLQYLHNALLFVTLHYHNIPAEDIKIYFATNQEDSAVHNSGCAKVV